MDELTMRDKTLAELEQQRNELLQYRDSFLSGRTAELAKDIDGMDAQVRRLMAALDDISSRERAELERQRGPALSDREFIELTRRCKTHSDRKTLYLACVRKLDELEAKRKPFRAQAEKELLDQQIRGVRFGDAWRINEQRIRDRERELRPRSDNYFDRAFPHGVLPQQPRPRRRPSERFALELPFAIDKATGELFSARFDIKNHAFAYLLASSGSGKTSLLHMLILDILSSYHPDDVELWLIELKGTEFPVYRDLKAPHIRYLLSSADENVSRRYALDILDRLDRERARRAKLCNRYKLPGGETAKDVSELPENVYCPLLLAVIDEYKVIDQIVSKSPKYVEKLQLLLSQGRALGMCIIFSSQELNGDALGASMGNIKTRISLDSPESHPRFFRPGTPDWSLVNGFEAFNSAYAHDENGRIGAHHLRQLVFRKDMGDLSRAADAIRREYRDFHSIRPEAYTHRAPQTQYVDKHFSFVDASSRDLFRDYRPIFKAANSSFRQTDLREDIGLFLHPGKPCSFARSRSIRLYGPKRRNLLLILKERGDQESLLLISQTIAALLISAREDGAAAELWTPGDSELYRFGKKNGLWDGATCRSGSAVWDHVHALASAEPSSSRERKLILILDLIAQVEELPRDSRRERLNELGSLLTSPGSGGLYFALHVNDLSELESLSASYRLTDATAFGFKGYDHILTDYCSENRNGFPFGELRAKLDRGLLFYSNEKDTACIYSPFDFELHAESPDDPYTLDE